MSDGFDGMDGYHRSLVVREPLVLIRGRVVLGSEILFSNHMIQLLDANSYSIR